MKDIEIALESADIHAGEEIRGAVTVNYSGRFDGIVINAQILDSNELLTYRSCNKKKTQQSTRLFVQRDLLVQNRAEFTASIDFEPARGHDVKFRASVIEQHKEIESDVLFARFS